VPLYEFECVKNGHRFELIRKFSDPPVTTCIRCKSRVRKLISPSAIAFKGSGWYVTDYARKRGGDGASSGNGAGGEGKDSAGSAASAASEKGSESATSSPEASSPEKGKRRKKAR
jgi:putative FmdB family regulatory protein